MATTNTNGSSTNVERIDESSKFNGLTLMQMNQINSILASRAGNYLSESETAQINAILSEPGTASAEMGAVWTPLQSAADQLIDVPKTDASSGAWIPKHVGKVVDGANVLGMVSFEKLSAMGRSDYDEFGMITPRFAAMRGNFKQRAIAFTMFAETTDGQEYSTKYLPVQIHKPIIVENDKLTTDKASKWTYEPWSQSQFVNPRNVVADVINRQLFDNMIPNAFTSDEKLSDWLNKQPISRKQMTALVTQSGLTRAERSMDGKSETTPLATTYLTHQVSEAASKIVEFLQNNGYTYTLKVENDSQLSATVNTGAGQYRVKIMDLQHPSNLAGIGRVTGEGISLNVDRTINSKTEKGKYRKEQGVDLSYDTLGPLRVVTGQSDIKDVRFNIDGFKDVTHEDFVKASTSKALKTSVVYTSDEYTRKVGPDGKLGQRQAHKGLIDISRNTMVLDTAVDEGLSLQEMIDEVNTRLRDVNLDPVESSAENNYENLPLAAISQLYSRETVINALLKAGIDANELRKSRYDGDVHLVMSDIKPLSPDAFLEPNIDRIVDLIDADDVRGSVAKMGLDDVRLLIEISEDDPELLAAATSEFNKRIGLDVSADEKVVDDLEEEDVKANSIVDDEKVLDQKIVPLKESLMTAMAGRFVSKSSLKEHTVAPEDYTEAEAKWVEAIKMKIASRLQITKPTGKQKEALAAYQAQLDRIRVILDDQHVVHWAVADEKNPSKLAVNSVSNRGLTGSIGQLFLPDKDGMIELDYTGGSKGYAVAGYNAYFVTGKEQLRVMRNDNAFAAKRGKPQPWSKEEMDLKFLNSEDSLPYRIRLSGFDEELDRRLDQLLTRQITLGIDDTLGDNIMMNRLYKGKDTYMTRITNDLVLSDKRLIKHLASRVYMDEGLFTDAGNKILGRHVDENGQLIDLAAKYTPESLSGTIFDKTNIAGLGNSHFLSEGALSLISDKETKRYHNGRFLEHFTPDSEYMKNLKLHPTLQQGLLMNQSENKYHNGDPTDRVSMAGNQEVHADSYVDNTKLALMTFGGYTMDDGNIITEKYAERVGREQAEMVARVRIAQGDYAHLINAVQHVIHPDAEPVLPGKTYSDEQIEHIRDKFVEVMSTTSTRDGGFKLAVGDKLSTFHGNKTTISHVVSEAEMQPGQKFEMFGQNPELEVVMPPESIISRLNMGEVQELMDGKVTPVMFNGKEVGYYGTTRMINTEIKASHKMHAYGPGDGRHVGAQLLWMLNAREHSDVIIDEIYGNNGKAAVSLMNYMELTGVKVDPETGVMSQGIAHSDADLNNPDYLREHMITVIDPTQKNESDKMLPVHGGYIKLPIPVHLPNMAPDETTSYLPVLPEALRQGQELPSGQMLEQDRTRRYKQIVELIADGRGEDTYDSRNKNKSGQSLLQDRVDSLTAEIIRSKLGGIDGAANKVSHTRRHVMGATVPNSATAPATNNPELPLDTIEVGPEVYKTLNLSSPDHQVLMWRDPALHAGSVMAFKVKLNPNISGVGMNPVIATPFGGDFDGDTYGIYAPRYSEESQQVLRDEYSVESYLKDMGKRVEDRRLVMTDVELNTGMDFTAGAVASGVKNSKGETIKNKGMLEDELRTILERGAYDEDSHIVEDVTKLWRESQAGNIGADKINLLNRDTVQQSMVDIAKIGAKGKVEVNDAGEVTNLKGLAENMARFDRLGYYDGNDENHVFDHLENGLPKYGDEIRNNAQSKLAERYAKGVVDRAGRVKIEGHEAELATVAKADREIEKATVAKQLLTASSGQLAIDLNKTAVDIEDKSLSSRISEMTQITTQAALQVKHDAAIVPALNKGISTISTLNTKGEESYEDYLANRQKVFEEMGMPEGYSQHFMTAGYESTATDELYGDTRGSIVDAGSLAQEDHMNETRSKSAVTQASSPLALLSYNGARYLKELAESNRSLYEGNVSGKLVSALPKAYNRTVPVIDQVDERSAEITTKYYTINKSIAQAANRDIRDESFAKSKPLAKLDELAQLRPKTEDVKKVVNQTVKMIADDKAAMHVGDEAVTMADMIRAQIGQSVEKPTVARAVDKGAFASKLRARSAERQQDAGMSR